MGQEPNIQLHLEDLPRAASQPGPARRWRPRRPGDLNAPGQVPSGPGFGTPGPDTGYALRLLADLPLVLGRDERRADAEGILAVLMGARASRFGRAPIAEDAEVAMMILGFPAPGAPAADPAGRRRFYPGAEGRRRLLESVSPALLAAPAAEIRRRWEAGERLIA